MKDNEKIIVSVIMLTYNHERFVEQALRSVLNQNVNFKYEILIGDDASTDRTQDIIKKYAKLYPNLIRAALREINIGATKNSYELLNKANGKYLATLEGDDYWTDMNKLQIQVDFLEKHSNFIACTHEFKIVDENNIVIKNQKLNWVKQKDVFKLDDFKGVYLPGQPSTFVRRNIFLDCQNRYDIIFNTHSMIADRTLMLIFLLKGDFYLIHKNMSAYRKCNKSSSITSKLYGDSKCMAWDDYKITCVLENFAKENGGLSLNFNSRKKDCFCSAIINWIKTGNVNSINQATKIMLEQDKWLEYIIYIPIFIGKKLMKGK